MEDVFELHSFFPSIDLSDAHHDYRVSRVYGIYRVYDIHRMSRIYDIDLTLFHAFTTFAAFTYCQHLRHLLAFFLLLSSLSFLRCHELSARSDMDFIH